MITQVESKKIQGVAIILMIFHHLFGFPQRMLPTPDLSPYLVNLAHFGQVCVSIFFFISGYGLFLSANYTIFRKLASLYFVYLLSIVFGVVLMIFFERDFSIAVLIRQAFLFDFKFNSEHWFIRNYFINVLIFLMLDRKIFNLKLLIFIFFLFIFFKQINLYFLSDLLLWLLPFLVGGIFAKHDFLKSKFPINLLVTVFAVLYSSMFTFGLTYVLIFSSPFIIYFLIHVFRKIDSLFLSDVLEFLGANSIYFWLTHTYANYYVFAYFIYGYDNPFIIFLKMTFLSLFLAFGLYLFKIQTTKLYMHLVR